MLLILASGEFAIVLGFAGTALRSMTGSVSQRIPKVNFSAAGVGERDVVQQKLKWRENEPAPSSEGAGGGGNRAEVVLPGLSETVLLVLYPQLSGMGRACRSTF